MEALLIILNLLIIAIVIYIAFDLRRNKRQQYSGTKVKVNNTAIEDKALLYDIVLDHIPCAVVTISPTYQVLMINEATTVVRGVTEEVVLGRNYYDVFEAGVVCPDCPVTLALTTAKSHKRIKKGCYQQDIYKYIEQTAVPVLNSNGSVRYVVELTLDATEKVELEQQNQQLAVETVTSLAKLIGSRDLHTGEHSARVRDIAVTIGRELQLPAPDMSELAIAAVLHDIGKIGIPEQILNKTGKLTEHEFSIIQKHPQVGYDTLVNIKQLEKVAEYILYHHECFDGRGYPSRKKGYDIPLISRILCIADVYEAITSDRVYRKAMNLEQTMMVMNAGRESKFDPEILDAFFCILRRERPDVKQYLYDNEAVS